MSNAEQVSNIVSDLKGDICIIFNALKKMEKLDENKENDSVAVEQQDNDNTNNNGDQLNDLKTKLHNQKLIRNFRKLEEAFRNLSIDFQDN